MPKVEQFNKEVALNNALQLFWKNGFNGTSIRELEKVMNLGKSSIYNTFGDKEDLFCEALNYYINSKKDRIVQRFENAGSNLAAIRGFFDSIVDDCVEEQNSIGCFVINSTAELVNNNPRVKQFANDNKTMILLLLENLIQKAQQSAEIPAQKDPKALALYLFSAKQGLKLTAMLVNDPKDLSAVIDNILKSLTS